MKGRFVYISDIADALDKDADYLERNFFGSDGPLIDIDKLLDENNMLLWNISQDICAKYDDIVQQIKSIDESLVFSTSVPPKKYVNLSVMAGKLNMTEKGFIERLTEDGLIDGRTQSKKARRYGLFKVDQGAARYPGGLVYKAKPTFKVTPKGQLYLLKRYGQKN